MVKVVEIEKIEGKNRILLIAPHAFPGDDNNTGMLTREIADKLECYAIINEKYQKPKKRKDKTTGRWKPDQPDISKNIINLNRYNQVKTHLQKEFLEPVLNYTDRIIKDHGSALVLWIHGIKDKNITSKVVDGDADNTQIVLGYGQGTPDSFTVEKETLDALINLLKENGNKEINAVPAKKGKKYCGWDSNIMNQLFVSKKYALSKVQSIQLEIDRTLRNEKKIDETADILGNALSKLAKSSSLVQIEKKPDVGLVDRAYNTLAEIFSRHYENAMMEAGWYLIKEFYGGDLERARRNDAVEKESLYQLILRLQNRSSTAPSKSWIYNAVNLVVDSKDFEGFHTYGKLLLSHKVLLLPIKEIETKKDLIKEIASRDLTIQQLRERISKINNAKKQKIQKKADIQSLIKNPNKLFSQDSSPLLETKSFLEYPYSSLESLQDTVRDKIEELKESLKNLNSYLTQYQVLMGQIEVAKEQRTEKPISLKKRSKFQDWVYQTVSCCNGCLNDCIYCFSKGDAIFQKKRLTHEKWKEGKVREHDVRKNYRYMNTPIMFPGTHDITDDNFEVCYTILDKLLKAGNRVLIVSKPRLQHIEKIGKDFEDYNRNMLFRFTIGSMNDDILSFWEPNAPSYANRKDALKFIYNAGFRTSISIEPMLDADKIEDLVDDLSPFVTHSIWIGTMNHMWYFDVDENEAKTEVGILRARANRAYLGEKTANRLKIEKKKIEDGQNIESLKRIYSVLKDKKLQGSDEPLIRWKWHIRKSLGLPQPEVPENWPID